MGEHQTFRITKPKRFTVLILLGLLVAGIGVHIYFRFHLDGVYDVTASDFSWVFKDGQIYMKSEKGREHTGAFKRVGGRWVCRPLTGGDDSYLQSSLLGVTLFSKQFQGGELFCPRHCFSTFADTLYHWHIRL
jgi:hypothetical protein